MQRDHQQRDVATTIDWRDSGAMSVHRDPLSRKVGAMIERMLDVGLEASLDDAGSLRIGLDAAREILAPDATEEHEHVPSSDIVVIN
jgi:hypothetical protein